MARGSAQAPSASVEVLDAARRELHRTHIALLAQSRNRTVRETIASRSDVPLGIQAALAQDDATEVRAAVAGNAHTARSVLDYLCSDKSHAVLASMLANANVPREIVERLTFHRRSEVRILAAGRLNDTSRPPRVEDPQVEDARFPELRERGTISEFAEVADAPIPSEQPSHGFAVVDMSSRELVPPSTRAWATSRTEPPARGAVTEPTSPRLAPARGFRFSEVS
ncbi:MAG: hypothetical protein CVT68_00675 [Actinobacteria bacterium HGW-Actinobacteria-8]|nr:MAG: hypothetical protein CVT68_00675 [Actinobacteria bacterium HGW-Actinobacteria-8]